MIPGIGVSHYLNCAREDALADGAMPVAGQLSTMVPENRPEEMIVMPRQWKLQRERLQADFTKALDNFQRAQRSAAQKEKDAIKKYKNQGVRHLLFSHLS